jgi:uncharacterized protein YdhG (YjbR/CyaY superfamily)
MSKDQSSPVDEYLAAVEWAEAREALSRLRAIIRDEVPDADEVISYGMPGYKLNGPIVWFAAFKNHCSLFAAHTVGDFTEELKGYKISKGTIQFKPDKPLPEALVRAIVRARLAENLADKN